MKRIFSVLVENRSGVLTKVSGLFARRNFNIDSLAVGETETHELSRMTIVSSGSESTMEQVEKQLNKKLDVVKLKSFGENEALTRELILVKVRYNKTTRQEILSTCQLVNAQIVDCSVNTLMIQLCDTPQKVQLLLDLLKGISIVEVARTGTLALPKCSEQ